MEENLNKKSDVQTKKREINQSFEEDFQFVLSVDDNIICQRFFKILDFEEKNLWKIKNDYKSKLVQALDECVEMIQRDLESKSRIYMSYTENYPTKLVGFKDDGTGYRYNNYCMIKDNNFKELNEIPEATKDSIEYFKYNDEYYSKETTIYSNKEKENWILNPQGGYYIWSNEDNKYHISDKIDENYAETKNYNYKKITFKDIDKLPLFINYENKENTDKYDDEKLDSWSVIFKFSFIFNENFGNEDLPIKYRPLYERIWDGTVYPKYIRNKVDLTNSDLDIKYRDPYSLNFVQSMIKHMVDNKKDLTYNIIKKICDATSSFRYRNNFRTYQK